MVIKVKTIYTAGIARNIESYEFMIFEENGKYYARDRSGEIKFSGTDASTVIQSALNNLPSPRNWRACIITKGMFYLTNRIDMPTYVTWLNFGRLEPADGATLDYLVKMNDFTMLSFGNWEGSFSGLGKLTKAIIGGDVLSNICIQQCLIADSNVKGLEFTSLERSYINSNLIGAHDDWLIDIGGGQDTVICGNSLASTDGGVARLVNSGTLGFLNNVIWKGRHNPTTKDLIHTEYLIDSLIAYNIIQGESPTLANVGIHDGCDNNRTVFRGNIIRNCNIGIRIDEDPEMMGEAGFDNLIEDNDLFQCTTKIEKVTLGASPPIIRRNRGYKDYNYGSVSGTSPITISPTVHKLDVHPSYVNAVSKTPGYYVISARYETVTKNIIIEHSGGTTSIDVFWEARG